jgi:hypothetical protein
MIRVRGLINVLEGTVCGSKRLFKAITTGNVTLQRI